MKELYQYLSKDFFPFHPIYYLSFPLIILYFCFSKPEYYLLKASPIWACSIACASFPSTYSRTIAIGLFFGSIGDILLEMDDCYGVDLFIFGLLSFLIGHLCYIKAFYLRQIHRYSRLIGLPMALVYFAVIMSFLLPNVSVAMIVPVAIYGIVICLMILSAFNRFLFLTPYFTGIMCLLGSLFFIVSDSILSINSFYISVPSEGLLVMITYYLGQLMIAASAQFPLTSDDSESLYEDSYRINFDDSIRSMLIQ